MPMTKHNIHPATVRQRTTGVRFRTETSNHETHTTLINRYLNKTEQLCQ